MAPPPCAPLARPCSAPLGPCGRGGRALLFDWGRALRNMADSEGWAKRHHCGISSTGAPAGARRAGSAPYATPASQFLVAVRRKATGRGLAPPKAGRTSPWRMGAQRRPRSNKGARAAGASYQMRATAPQAFRRGAARRGAEQGKARLCREGCRAPGGVGSTELGVPGLGRLCVAPPD
jgi:hypothetical protein